MRRGRREKHENNSFKRLVYIAATMVVIILATFIITFIVYNNKLKNSGYSSLTTEEIADLVPNNDEFLKEANQYVEEASSDIGKSIEEAINSMEKEKVELKEENINSSVIEKETNSKVEKVENESKEKEEIVKDPEFSKPVDGEIMRGFAKDSLIYSDTLEEWITHLGIDIKADRTTIVKSSESGKVTSIKNDPRYGLTVVVEHVNGYKTVYSNLLTTEFVTEGEDVDKGQSLGTIGNSASFEIVDEPHLHFEILKDNVNVDPNIYLK